MRIAEIPIYDCSDRVRVPVLDKETNELIIKEFDKADTAIDFSDPRVIRTPDGNYLTTISHLRIAK